MQTKETLSEHTIATTFLSLAAKDNSKRFITKSLWAALFALIFFAISLAVVGALIVLSDQKTEDSTLRQTTELAAQGIQNRISSTAEIISRSSARLLHAPNSHFPVTSAKLTAQTLMEERREIMEISVIDNKGTFLRSWTNSDFPISIERKNVAKLTKNQAVDAFNRSKKLDIWTLSAPYADPEYNGVLADILIPTDVVNQFIIVRIDVDTILKDIARYGISDKYFFSFLDNGKVIRANTRASTADGVKIEHSIPLFFFSRDPDHEISLQGQTFKYNELFANKIQFITIVVLSIVLVAAICMLLFYQREQTRALTLLNAEYSLRRAMSESSVVGFRVTDKAGRILYVNETFQKLVGYSYEELINKYPPYPYWNDDITHQLSQIVDNDTLLSQPIRFTVKKKNGDTFLGDLRISPLIDEKGNNLGYIGALYDVTAETRAQERLEAANQRFTIVVESLSSAIIVLSRADYSNVLFANRAYREKFGSDSLGIRRLLTKQSEKRTPNHNNESIFDDVSKHWFDVKSQEIDWNDGSKALLVIAIDVTTRREYELARQAQMRKSEATQRLVTMGEMTSSLAHELNQPLAAASNYAGAAKMLLEANQMTKERLIEAFNKIENQTLRAGKIIQRIRSFTKKTDPKFEVTSIHSIISETMELALIQAEKLHSEISVSIEEGIDKLYCDQVMIEQLLLNLIKNAMEACLSCQRHTIEVVAKKDVYSEKDVVRFFVIDHGPGICDSEKAKLFDAFYSTKSEGMGMGLNICRTIAEVHEGHLTVKDTPGGGSTFSFTVRVPQKND